MDSRYMPMHVHTIAELSIPTKVGDTVFFAF